ncbi:MAG: VOC family protein, partial [Frankia sp.]
MFTRIDHVGIAVHDLDASIAWYESTFDLRMVAREFNEEQGIEEAMMLVFDGATGGSHVQLLRPTRDDSPIGKSPISGFVLNPG